MGGNLEGKGREGKGREGKAERGTVLLTVYYFMLGTAVDYFIIS